MKYDKIFIRHYNGISYLNGGPLVLKTNDILVSDKSNCCSKDFIDLYWSVGDVGFRDNELLTNKIKEI